MATDTTETTFVRCPACRSLVPAVSTRCRMCGATLDAAAASEPTQPQQSGRVRQQTLTTASSSDMADQVGRVREEMGAPAEPPPAAMKADPGPVPQQSAPKSSDPLAGYIEDEEEDIVEDEDLLDDDYEDDFDDDSGDDSDDDYPEEKEEANAAAPEHEEPAPQMPLKAEPVQEMKPPPPPPPPVMKKEEPAPVMMKKEEPAPPAAKVVVEQGKAKASRGGSTASGKQSSDGGQRRFDVAQPPKRSDAPAAPVKETPVMKEQPVAKESAPERAPAAREKTKEVIKKGEELGGLYAWLVSYSDPNGTSIELREGRFFVSAEQLRSTDMVFEDSTISTPHAMFTISEDEGIVIQDLKSERGVFVRERGATAYRREYDSSQLKHGDWVRFGDLEFLVSIIATATE